MRSKLILLTPFVALGLLTVAGPALLASEGDSIRNQSEDVKGRIAAQYDQLLRIGNKLKAMSDDDLMLYRIVATNVTKDLDAVERTLEEFYQRLQPFAIPFMALFDRDQLPARSTLSRF